MDSVKELLESASFALDDLNDIENKVYRLYNKSKYIFRRLILDLYEHYRDGKCHVPRIEDIGPELKLSCSRKDVGDILNWIHELLPYLESCDDEGEYIIECINNDKIGIDMCSKLKCVQEAIRCIEYELKKNVPCK